MILKARNQSSHHFSVSSITVLNIRIQSFSIHTDSFHLHSHPRSLFHFFTSSKMTTLFLFLISLLTDQPHAHTILTFHVLLRSFQSDVALGSVVDEIKYLIQRRRRNVLSSFSIVSNAATVSTSLLRSISSLTTAILRSMSTSALVRTGILTLTLVRRMQGKIEAEWQDRSWRLL